MSVRVKHLVFSYAVVLAGVILILLLPHREPTYEAKTLTQWVSQLSGTNLPGGWASDSEQQQVRNALSHMDTKAIMLLADWACYDRPLRRRLIKTLPQPLQDLKALQTGVIDDPHVVRGICAGKALILLGPQASPAFPKLRQTLTDGEFFGVATRALWILREIGEPAVPTLVCAMTNKPSRMRIAIASNLGNMGLAASNAVPALYGLLGNPESGLHNTCVASLTKITGSTPTNTPPN